MLPEQASLKSLGVLLCNRVGVTYYGDLVWGYALQLYRHACYSWVVSRLYQKNLMLRISYELWYLFVSKDKLFFCLLESTSMLYVTYYPHEIMLNRRFSFTASKHDTYGSKGLHPSVNTILFFHCLNKVFPQIRTIFRKASLPSSRLLVTLSLLENL